MLSRANQHICCHVCFSGAKHILTRGDPVGYSIDYEKGPVKRNRQDRPSYRTQMGVACFLIFLILVNLFWPEGTSMLKTVLIPQLWKSEAEAVEAFLLDVREGNTVAQSLRTFFRVILRNAGF